MKTSLTFIVVLCLDLLIGIHCSDRPNNVGICPSTVESTERIAKSIDQLTKVLNQTQNSNLQNALLDQGPIPNSVDVFDSNPLNLQLTGNNFHNRNKNIAKAINNSLK